MMTGGMPLQYGGSTIPGNDPRMMVDHTGDAIPLGAPYVAAPGIDVPYGGFLYSQPPSYGMVPMMIHMPRIAPRELPPFVHWKDKKKPREDGARDGSAHDATAPMSEEEAVEEEEEEEETDTNDSSQRVSKHGAHARRNTGEVCKFFIKHGSCAYGSMCKFKHPVDMAPLVHFNRFGLPRRPGSEVCKYFLKTGRCSYGHTCKFDHPEVVPYQYDPNVQQIYM